MGWLSFYAYTSVYQLYFVYLDQEQYSYKDHGALGEVLCEYAAQWKDIALALGFRPAELHVIQSYPLLLLRAPVSLLNEMLSQWLQWFPGDERGSWYFPNKKYLQKALLHIGLSACSDRLPPGMCNAY